MTSPDAPEFQPRSSHPYEGGGSGQVESRLPEEAVSYGLGYMERKASERLGHELGSRKESLPHPKVGGRGGCRVVLVVGVQYGVAMGCGS